MSRFAGIVIITVWLLSMRTLSNDIRAYYMPIFLLKNAYIRRVKKGILWQAEASGSKSKRNKRKAVFPFEVHAFGDIGLIHTRHKKADTMVFASTGSPISSLNLHDQYTAHASIADVFRRAAAIAGMKIEISMGVRARPEDPWKFWNTISAIGEGEVVLPAAFVTAEQKWTDYDRRMLVLNDIQSSLAQIGQIANDVDMVLLITVQRPPAFDKAVKKQTIEERESNQQPIMRIKSIAIPLLEKILKNGVTILDAEGAERYLRKSWDVIGLSEYYNRANERLINGDFDTHDQWYAERLIRVTDRYVQIDDTFGATLKMHTYPKEAAYPYDSRAFYAAGSRWFSNGVIGETVNGGWEYRILNTSQGFLSDIISVSGIQWSGPKVERKEQEVTDRLREIDQSTYTESYNPLSAISAGSAEELEINVQGEIDRLTAEGMSPIRVIGESKQFSSYLSATTFIDVC